MKLANHGAEGHQVIFLKLPTGKTYAQHMMDMQPRNGSMDGMGGMSSNTTDPHMGATFVGGVVSASPGDNESAYVFLTPGTYVLECDIPGPGGAHAMHGMTKELTVTGTAPPMGDGPVGSDATMRLVDYNFTFGAPLAAGHHVVKVTNDGTMPHEAVFVHLLANKTVQDFLAWEQMPMGPPPASDTFGAGALSPGQTGYFVADLKAGDDYGLICFLPDAEGRPHLMHGMVTQLHIA